MEETEAKKVVLNINPDEVKPDKKEMPKYILDSHQKKSIEEFYEITGSELGRGTYGRVVLANLKGSKLSKAIKIIPKARVSNYERFKSEIEIMKKQDHPNIVRLYESFEDAINVYLVLEICEGGELFDRIIAKKYYDETGARRIFRQIMRGILYCHAKGVCHRDQKPENFLFLNQDDLSILKLIDFGLSKNFIEGPLNSTQDSPLKMRNRRQQKLNMKTRAGTPFYIAPEVLTGNYNEKCDVWSAGVIMYILLCGYPPFYGETNKEILEQVKKGKLDFSGPEWKGKSNICFDLIKRMICRPEDRLSAEDVLKHPWMQIQDDVKVPEKSFLKKCYENIITYSKLPKFTRTIQIYMTRQMNEKDVNLQMQAFNHIDKMDDGLLSFTEFVENGMSLGLQKTQLMSVFEELDIHQNKHLTYTQFCAGALGPESFVMEDNIFVAFRIWDQDKDGELSYEDVNKFIKYEYPGMLETAYGKIMMTEYKDLGYSGMKYEQFQHHIRSLVK